MNLATIDEALVQLGAGRPVLVADDADRENEVDLIMPGANADPRWMGWAVRHGSGVICAPLTSAIADRLALPPMVGDNQDPKGTAYTVSVDAANPASTGISAADRTETVRILASPTAAPTDLTRPGHIFPLRARDGGVLERPGHTEAAVDLCRLAGLPPVGVIVELVHDDGSMMRLAESFELAREADLAVITIADLVAWRRLHDRVRSAARTVLPTEHGEFTVTAYVDRLTGAEHLALTAPQGTGTGLVRVHSECLTGDVFGSRRCDCGPQLQLSMEQVAAEGGTIVYLRGHEGRGVGLADKLRAYEQQDIGYDTVDAQTLLGLPVDAREYDAAAAILHDQKIDQVRLLTNNPRKVDALRDLGINVIETVPLHAGLTAENERYLQTKRDKMGHTAPIGTPGKDSEVNA